MARSERPRRRWTAALDSPKGRFEAFSDGVFSIAITLLVLDVRVPDASDIASHGSLFLALIDQWPTYIAYLTSFFSIGVVWMNHRAAFSKFATVDRGVQWWNLALLMTIAFTPFPNALAASAFADGLFSEPARTASVMFGLVFTALTTIWAALWTYVIHRPKNLMPEFGKAYAHRERRRAGLGAIIYLCSSAVAVVAPPVATLLYLATVAFYGISSEGEHTVGEDDEGFDPTPKSAGSS